MRYIKRSIFTLLVLAALGWPLRSISQACDKVKISDFPAKDLPSDFDRQQVKLEPSYRYYYGVGMKIDYTRARLLAFIEMQKESGGRGGEFEGSGILMMLYTNGFGVERNLDIAIRLACANVDGAPAELEGRIQHLKDIQSSGSKDVFDICDDLSSGYMMGMCQSIQSELAAVERKAKINSVTKKWPVKDRVAYGKLREAASAFFDKRANEEVDLSGTARAMFALEESDSLEDEFETEMVNADKCIFIKYSSADFVKADKELNAVYSKIMSDKDSTWGTITKAGIRSTQRNWIQYRNAWVVFGAVRCPGLTAVSWETLITQERIKQLRDIIEP